MTSKQQGVLDVALEPIQEPPPQTPASDVALMFERLAKDPAVDVDKFERLMAMQERVLAYNARTAFNTAFAAMQGEIPAIVERGKTNNGRYARLEDIVEQVRPILRKHGFTLSHRTEWPDAKTVRVVGILTHEQGHERTSEFLSSADSSGNKNAIQALGSAVSYGRRYTVKDLLNIVTRDEDDDGQRSEQYKAPDAPDGYEEWWLDIEACAEEGLPKLTAAWNKSKQDFRKYTSKFHLQEWEALKRKAAKGGAE
jgi:hypothetical protein